MSELPEGWIETTLGEVAEISSSKRIFSKEYTTSGIPFFRGKEITEQFNGNKVSTELFISEEKYNEIKKGFGVPTENDILLTSVGTLGNPWIVEKGLKFYFKDGNLTWFRDYKNIFPKFLYHWLISNSGKEGLSHAVIGSTQKAYTIAGLKKVKINLPPLPEQKAIAAVLSAFDDKIELLREQNRTLETLAQTIFKEWFVHFNFPNKNGKPYRDNGGEMVDSELGEIPLGWRVGKLGEVVKTNTSSINKNSNLKTIQYLDTGSITKGHIGSIQELKLFDAPSRARRIVHHNDILISTVRPNLKHYGLLKKPDNNLIVSTGFCVISSGKIDPHFVYYLLTASEMTDYLHSVAEGSTSTYPSIKPSDIESIEFILPTENVLNCFAKCADKIWGKILFNQNQIQILTKTRDTLLPKLMTGEIRVGADSISALDLAPDSTFTPNTKNTNRAEMDSAPTGGVGVSNNQNTNKADMESAPTFMVAKNGGELYEI